MEETKTKKITRNIWQKLNVIKNNLAEAGGSRNAFLNLTKEQECLVYFNDDIVGDFCKSTICLADIETGDTISASGIETTSKENFTTYSRTYALKALLGCFDNTEKLFPKSKPVVRANTDTSVKSPTPAQTPSEPSGGVPKGFTGFNK